MTHLHQCNYCHDLIALSNEKKPTFCEDMRTVNVKIKKVECIK